MLLFLHQLKHTDGRGDSGEEADCQGVNDMLPEWRTREAAFFSLFFHDSNPLIVVEKPAADAAGVLGTRMTAPLPFGGVPPGKQDYFQSVGGLPSRPKSRVKFR